MLRISRAIASQPRYGVPPREVRIRGPQRSHAGTSSRSAMTRRCSVVVSPRAALRPNDAPADPAELLEAAADWRPGGRLLVVTTIRRNMTERSCRT
jgi:hypothetical protein